ncbi:MULTISPECIES: nucleotidyltransferase family protein [unclassified Haematospirillum]|uniref:nucleotidyltransferase family protein n=1 Tax=unclassified Haematospirillum TaxID=2622088 RepID=UPI0014394856|nr:MULTISPECIES: nucleotidyltransferase family protein [unclassified Haematospirillum]NKD55422.1 nucleotidyltransferase family protein [Haematospirillum sp. H4890]NKD75450.1 nucleotidyltransferase family protein [Haematospirillum sp. H4485]
MSILPRMAMVLAAGTGTRMRPLTNHTPKPLIRVLGKTMLDRTLDHLANAGVAGAVVNIHHHPDQMRAHLATRTGVPDIFLSDESNQLLDSGGGVRNALPLLGNAPFLILNADIVWLNGSEATLPRLARYWDPARMDALLLLQNKTQAIGYEGRGDFFRNEHGVLHRIQDHETEAPLVYTGIMMIGPAAFMDTPSGPFSLNMVFDKLLATNRLHGLVHDGPWFHVGTPEAIGRTEQILQHLEHPATATTDNAAAVVR